MSLIVVNDTGKPAYTKLFINRVNHIKENMRNIKIHEENKNINLKL